MTPAFIAGAFGLIVGSFLNVLVIRHNTGRSVTGRSGCLSCGETLEPLMLIPVISWLLLRARCSACGTRISVQYPLVELATGAAFFSIALAASNLAEQITVSLLAAIMIAIAAYDIRHTIIPDSWAYAAALLALLAYALHPHAPAEVFNAVLVGLCITAAFAALWFVTRGRGIGLGDAKLALSAGALLGPVHGIIAAGLSFVIGAAVSLAILMPLPQYRRLLKQCGILSGSAGAGFTMKSEIPFGPFLIAGIFIVWFIQALMGAEFLPALFSLA